MAALRDDELLSHLSDFVRTKAEDDEFTIERLREVFNTDDSLLAAEVVAIMVEKGVLEQFVRVESTLGSGGIDDFPSLLAVPEKIFDWRTQQDVDVTLDNIRIMYRPPQSKGSQPGG